MNHKENTYLRTHLSLYIHIYICVCAIIFTIFLTFNNKNVVVSLLLLNESCKCSHTNRIMKILSI